MDFIPSNEVSSWASQRGDRGTHITKHPPTPLFDPGRACLGLLDHQASFSFISGMKIFCSSFWMFLVHIAFWATASSPVHRCGEGDRERLLRLSSECQPRRSTSLRGNPSVLHPSRSPSSQVFHLKQPSQNRLRSPQLSGEEHPPKNGARSIAARGLVLGGGPTCGLMHRGLCRTCNCLLAGHGLVAARPAGWGALGAGEGGILPLPRVVQSCAGTLRGMSPPSAAPGQFPKGPSVLPFWDEGSKGNAVAICEG